MHTQVEQLLSRAESLFAQFEQGGEADHINEVIVLGRQALELCPLGHPKRWNSLTQLSRHLWNRYKKLGAMADIEEAISSAREALDLCPRGHPHRSISLNNLAVDLTTRYERLGGMEDLEEVIALGREVLVLRPRGHLSRSTSLSNISFYLFALYKRLGSMADLDEALVLGQEALDLRPRGHQDRPMSLHNVALYLSTRFQRLGELADLDAAIVLGREALDLRPPGHLLRQTSLNNVASYLWARYKQLGGMVDLDEAIILGREAVDLCPPGNPDRSMTLSNAAMFLSGRYDQLRGIADLNEAIVLGREALDLRPRGHPDRSMSLNNVSTYLFTQFQDFGNMANLNEAIVLGQEALTLCPGGHPLRPMALDSLSYHLSSRYNKLGGIADLHKAISLGREALQLCPPGHPERPLSLRNLARSLRCKFAYSTPVQSKLKEVLFGLYSETKNVPQMVSLSHVSSAMEWIDAAEEFRHPTTLLAYETCLRLLVHHLATSPPLPQQLPTLRLLTSSLAVDAFSAGLRNGHPEKSVELLEQGRGVFWSQISRLRSPLDDVIESGPAGKALVGEYTRLTSLIRIAINSPGPDQYDQICHLNLEMNKVVDRVRELPGHEHFLLPSLFSDLQHAASCGPIIIMNASKYSCDALVVFSDRDPVHIPMRITKDRVRDMSSQLRLLIKRAKTTDVKNDLGRFLRELWDDVVSPVVGILETTVQAQSRIWWCPTAEFSLLPLHAAGPYRKGQKNLSHLYISSYTPTLTALIRARRHLPSESATKEKHFVVVGQAQAIGQSKLASVSNELAIVGRRIEGLASFTRIEGSESCISRVSEELVKNEWVHFACHGLPNRQHPFDSAFALHDGDFTIQHIMRCELGNAEFAYLSACHTMVGDEKSPDEVIHLASAMQFAGFRSVIGTMWAVDDAKTGKIISMFYENVVDESGRLDYTRAAYALNKTMRKVVLPLDQLILYVHIGA